jgi:hypothetical protein
MALNEPIIRTYGSKSDYRRDAARMALFGFQATKVQTDRATHGIRLAAILITGLLLTPALVGVLILLLLPMAFSIRVTVSYVPALSGPPLPVIAMGVPAPLTRQLMPDHPADGTAQDAKDEAPASNRHIVLSWVADYLHQARAFIESCSPLQRVALVVAALVVASVGIFLSATVLATLLNLHVHL